MGLQHTLFKEPKVLFQTLSCNLPWIPHWIKLFPKIYYFAAINAASPIGNKNKGVNVE